MSASTTTDALFDKAVTHHQKGELDKAQALYRQVIAADPQDMDALQNLGLIEKQQGNFDTAIDLLEKVRAQRPEDPALLNNLGSTWRDAGDNEKAITLFEQGLTLNPGLPALNNNMGVSLQALDRHEEALPYFEKAVAKQPGFAEAQNNFGISLQKCEQLDKAIEHFRRAVTLRPSYGRAHANLGFALMAKKEFKAATRALDTAARHYEDAELLRARARALAYQGHYHEALPLIEKALAQEPDNPKAIDCKAECLVGLGDYVQALQLLERAIELSPHDPEFRMHKAAALAQFGDAEGAFKTHLEAIAEDPAYSESYYLAARIKKFKGNEPFVAQLREAYAEAGDGTEFKQNLGFGLGKIEEDLGNYEAAFDCLEAANSIYRSTIEYKTANTLKRVAGLKKLYTPKFFNERRKSGSPDKSPIFILGMPRSGTTLVEQILASHPDVFGAGELTYVDVICTNSKIFGENASQDKIVHATDSQLNHLGDTYIKYIRNLTDAPHVTDKMPGNFWNVGLIRLMLPNAKIIHCRRNPLDNCLAIYKVRFGTAGHNYAYDMTELGHYHNAYRAIMRHWHKVLPDTILDVDYEEVVADQETQSRRLLDFCGLDWDPAVLDFHKTERAVRTASSQQVRQPIYKSSVKLSERYGGRLDPLKKALAESA